jgi:multidrug efflux pump subunit AcrA (membrane-fusion protein)
LAVLLVLAAATIPWWMPMARTTLSGSPGHDDAPLSQHEHAHDDEHDEHEHEHEHEDNEHQHDDATAIALSESALRNIEYESLSIASTPYTRMMTLPGMVVERPGESQINITAPLTGVVTRIDAMQGAAVESGAPLFTLRLTHEEMVAVQRDLLKTAEGLDVVDREIQRLEGLSEGVVAGRRVLEQQYERQRLEASMKADRQALLLHGLTEQQVQRILDTRELFQTITVHAPDHTETEESCSDEHWFHVQQLPVRLGQQVEIGGLLCVLADHCELYVEGRAFADDAELIRSAARQNRSIDVSLLVGDRPSTKLDNLEILYLDNQIDTETRAFRFYLILPNEVASTHQGPRGRQFIEWRYKPGQRLELHVPVERWEEQFVLPVEAVVEEEAEAFVFKQVGDHFHRTPVNVIYRDRQSVVIASDGSISVGDVVAARGAYQMNLALKSAMGGGIDPHAGHNH